MGHPPIRELLSELPVRTQPSKPEIVPAWLPRSKRGYVVITCPDCLRSFSVLRNEAKPGLVIKDTCIHCGASVAYYVDATIVAEQATSPLYTAHRRVAAAKENIARSREAIHRSRKLRGADSSPKAGEVS